jgi:DNA sulfur modification protein DndB
MTSTYKYVFPAIKGRQAGRDYFVAMCPMNLLPKIFIFNEEGLPPDLRAQRTLNKSRVPEIKKYIINNPNDYVFSAITASVDGELNFLPNIIGKEATDTGHLEIAMDAKFLINDGQHRRAAIEAALSEYPELGSETIAVVFFVDENLVRSQQLFADLNKHVVKPSKSLSILYDTRDPLACLCRDLMNDNPLFKGKTEKEKTTISNRSLKLFTLSGIYHATGALLNRKKNQPITPKERKLANQYWKRLSEVIPEWNALNKQGISSYELRQDYVHSHSVILHALGVAGNELLAQKPDSWIDTLTVFSDINWSRTNPEWKGRAMIAGRMSKASNNIKLTSILLKKKLGLSLSEEDNKIEKAFFQGNDNI